MRRTSLVLGALLLAGRTVSAQTMPTFRSPGQPVNQSSFGTAPLTSARGNNRSRLSKLPSN